MFRQDSCDPRAICFLSLKHKETSVREGVTYKKTTPGSESDQDASGLVLVIQEYLPCLGKEMQRDQENQLGGFLFHIHPDRLACRH